MLTRLERLASGGRTKRNCRNFFLSLFFYLVGDFKNLASSCWFLQCHPFNRHSSFHSFFRFWFIFFSFYNLTLKNTFKSFKAHSVCRSRQGSYQGSNINSRNISEDFFFLKTFPNGSFSIQKKKISFDSAHQFLFTIKTILIYCLLAIGGRKTVITLCSQVNACTFRGWGVNSPHAEPLACIWAHKNTQINS